MPFNGRDVWSRDAKTNQTTFSHISLFWKHILQIFGDTPRNCTSMIIELQPSQIYFAFTQNQKLICNGEMQNRCRVQLSVQINIFLLKKEHLSATNQSSSCNYSFDCKFFFFQKVHLSFFIFQEVHLSLTNWTFGCTHQPVPSKIGKIAMSKSWKEIHFSFLDKYMFFTNTYFFSEQIYVFFRTIYNSRYLSRRINICILFPGQIIQSVIANAFPFLEIYLKYSKN